MNNLNNKIMKNIYSFGLRALSIAFLVILATTNLNAQPGPGGPGSSGSGIYYNGSSGSTPIVPFDGGISLLLAASGIGYAAKKLKRKKSVLVV